MNGGRDFRLGVQVDACGGFEDTLLIVECKTGPKRGKPLLADIRALRGKIHSIEAAAETDKRYRKYSNFVYALAINFPARERDNKESLKDPRVFLWDETFLDYYKDLLGKIGRYARYNLLGELRINPRVKRVVQTPAFKIPMGSGWAYLFFALPGEILRWSYVARREIGRQKYYQRLVQPGRLHKIAEYLDEGKYFPNAAIIAFNTDPSFDPFPEVRSEIPGWEERMEFGCLTFPATYRSCWIVDGQHRLYGFAKSTKSKLMMPVVALERVSIEEQAQLFLDINKTQKQVPADLVWDLEGEMRPNFHEGVISRVAKALNKDGVLEGRIYVPLQGPKKKQKLKLSGVCNAIKKRKLTRRVLEHNMYANPLFHEDPDRMVKNASVALKQGLSAANMIFDSWQKNEFWHLNSGMAIFIALFERILGHLRRKPTDTAYRKYLGPLNGHLRRYQPPEQMKRLRQRCNSEGGRDEVAAEFIRAIRRKTGEEIAPDVPDFEFEERIVKVERGLAAAVARALSQVTKNWFKERVSQDIRDRVVERMRKDKRTRGAPQDFMTIGEIAQLVKRKVNWPDLEGLFLVKGGFSSSAEMDTGFRTISRLRGDLVHGRATLDEADEILLDGYLKKFESVISKV